MAQLTTALEHYASSTGNNVLIGQSGGPQYNTTVHEGVSGRTKRIQSWQTPIHDFKVEFGGLLSELADLLALFEEAQGMTYSFVFQPLGFDVGSYRFADDKLDIKIAPSAEAPTDFIATVSFGLVEAIGE